MAEKGMSRKKHALAPCVEKKEQVLRMSKFNMMNYDHQRIEQHCIISFCCKGLIEKAIHPLKILRDPCISPC